MAFELDPVFHTETMVKILKAQGHLSLAANLLEKVLEKSPENPRMLSLRESLRNGGREIVESPVKPDLEEDEVTDPGTAKEALQSQVSDEALESEDSEEVLHSPVSEEAPPQTSDPLRVEKLKKLNLLLQKILERS